ncbi:MAG: nitroreductase family protein [Methanobrevibacter sp.]|uniref:nitroreductase family protein n=1 Tax=Methanobrevibacter sp. TaxID=66852 RepID=UPI0026DFF7CB|nr:nitroreductase family protein [Methanobrevibacter sp.]MDO5848738.1 nitroreductase family protein [Methanobrevibacter sp.]
MDLKDVIYKRRSHRDYYQNIPEDETINEIKDFILNAKPLYPDIETYSVIIGNEDVSGPFRWKAPQYIAIFSEKKPGYLTNVGFIYQQVDLFLQSIGLGSCWLGMGKFKPKTEDIKDITKNGEQFVILIGFGKVKGELYRDESQFKRKNLNDISDSIDRKLEVARLAPSAINSQPWYFIHEDGYYSVYCKELNFIRRRILGNLNKIDIGIALAHLYIANPETFEFFEVDSPIPIKDYYYIGSFKI